MGLEKTLRWFGQDDPLSLNDIKSAGVQGVVTSLRHIPIGKVWSKEAIQERKQEIEAAGLTWAVVENLFVHEDIKRRKGNYRQYIENYKQSLQNLAELSIKTICYNFTPVFNWVRTDSEIRLQANSAALRFEDRAFAAFDLYILNRPGGEANYNLEQKIEASNYLDSLSEKEKINLIDNIWSGISSTEIWSFSELKAEIAAYEGFTNKKLKSNLHSFLKEIIPTAEQNGLLMGIHPDNVPSTVFGLPKALSCEDDIKDLFQKVPSANNGLTFCTGTLAVCPETNMTRIIENWGSRIHYVHFRKALRDVYNKVYESDLCENDLSLSFIMKALFIELRRREELTPGACSIPFRADYGRIPKQGSLSERAMELLMMEKLQKLTSTYSTAQKAEEVIALKKRNAG